MFVKSLSLCISRLYLPIYQVVVRMLVPMLRVVVAALLAGFLGYRGLKKQSLDVSGAAAAFFVGFFTLASGYRFGTSATFTNHSLRLGSSRPSSSL